MSTFDSAAEVFAKAGFDETKHKRDHGKFSGNGGMVNSHWAGLKHGAGVGARIGAVLGGVPSALTGAAGGAYGAHTALQLGEEGEAGLENLKHLGGGKKAAIIGGTAALSGLTAGALGAVHGAAGGAVVGGAVGGALGRKRPMTAEESKAFVHGAKAAHEHNHGKDEDFGKSAGAADKEMDMNNSADEVFAKAREINKGLGGLLDAEKVGGAISGAKAGLGRIGSGVADGLNGAGNKVLGSSTSPKKLSNGLWHASDFARKNKVATGAAAAGVGVVGGGVAAKKTF